MKELIILNHQQIEQKIIRIAHQIYEDNYKEKELLITGIATRGFIFAKKIGEVLKKISHFKMQYFELNINKKNPLISGINSQELNDLTKNKTVILVDDVLNTGKTLMYALLLILNPGIRKIRTVVLVDRDHKTFPVAVDFAGLSLTTTLQEHIKVVFDEKNKNSIAYLC